MALSSHQICLAFDVLIFTHIQRILGQIPKKVFKKTFRKFYRTWQAPTAPTVTAGGRTSAGLMVPAMFCLLLFLSGCVLGPPLPRVDLSDPGWSVQQGQAVWKSRKNAPEIAGEIMLATCTNGSSWLQFSKTPLPLMVAQTTTNAWQLQIIPRNKTYRGWGNPPARVSFALLASCMSGHSPPRPWHWEAVADGNWNLTNWHSGESLSGYLTK